MPLVGILASEWARAFEKEDVMKEKNDVTTYREGAPPAPDRVGFPHGNRAKHFVSVWRVVSACCFSWTVQPFVGGGVFFVPFVFVFVFVIPGFCLVKVASKKISRCSKRNGFCLCGF